MNGRGGPDVTARLIEGLHELADTARLTAERIGPQIDEAYRMVRATIERGGTIFFCGNGGSAADAQHMATEYVVRYTRNRRPIAAVAITTDTSLITATGNDFDFDLIFARQVEALCRPGDLLVLHTTSGNSPNLLRAVDAAKANSVATVALSAKGGGRIAGIVDHCIVVPAERTDRAQELQLNIQHAICDMIDDHVSRESAASLHA